MLAKCIPGRAPITEYQRKAFERGELRSAIRVGREHLDFIRLLMLEQGASGGVVVHSGELLIEFNQRFGPIHLFEITFSVERPKGCFLINGETGELVFQGAGSIEGFVEVIELSRLWLEGRELNSPVPVTVVAERWSRETPVFLESLEEANPVLASHLELLLDFEHECLSEEQLRELREELMKSLVDYQAHDQVTEFIRLRDLSTLDRDPHGLDMELVELAAHQGFDDWSAWMLRKLLSQPRAIAALASAVSMYGKDGASPWNPYLRVALRLSEPEGVVEQEPLNCDNFSDDFDA